VTNPKRVAKDFFGFIISHIFDWPYLLVTGGVFDWMVFNPAPQSV
jgi:hypothetical protein